MRADTDKAAVVPAVPSDAVARELKAVRRAYDEQSFQAWLKAGKPQSTPEEIKKNKRNDDHFDACIDQLIQAVQTYVADTVACDAQEAFESWLQRVNCGFDSIDFVRIDGRYAQSHVEGMFHNFQAGFAAALSQTTQPQAEASAKDGGAALDARTLKTHARNLRSDSVAAKQLHDHLQAMAEEIEILAYATPPAATPAAPGGQLTAEQIAAIHGMPYVRACLLEYAYRPCDEAASAVVKAVEAQIAALAQPAPVAAPAPAVQFTEQEMDAEPRIYAHPGEYERRADGKVVRKDRWEWGIRNIVTTLWGVRHEFEIEDVVNRVRELAAPAPASEADFFVITKEWLHSNRTPKGGFLAAQMKAIGAGWPATRGWLQAAVGRKISQEAKAAFEAGTVSRSQVRKANRGIAASLCAALQTAPPQAGAGNQGEVGNG